MKNIFYCLLLLTIFAACKKQQVAGSRVDIYMLKSFTITTNTLTNPPSTVISNAILADTPLIADKDILFYIQSSATFRTVNNIKSAIAGFGPDKAFAVTVDNQVVYYGKVHPGFMSSMIIGLATIDPILTTDNELSVGYAAVFGSTDLQTLDKRSDNRITSTLKATGRLR